MARTLTSPATSERHVEQRQEPAVAGLRREIRLERRDRSAVADDRHLVVRAIAGRLSAERGERRTVEPDHPDLAPE